RRRGHPAAQGEARAGSGPSEADPDGAGVRLPGGRMRLLGLRGRLVATLIALVALTVVVVGVTSVFLVDRSLRNRLVDEAVATTEFNLAVLLPATGIEDPSDSLTLAEAGNIDCFLRRGPAGAGLAFEAGCRLRGGLAPVGVQPALDEIARRGEIGYEFVEAAGHEVAV